MRRIELLDHYRKPGILFDFKVPPRASTRKHARNSSSMISQNISLYDVMSLCIASLSYRDYISSQLIQFTIVQKALLSHASDGLKNRKKTKLDYVGGALGGKLRTRALKASPRADIHQPSGTKDSF